MKRYEKGEKEFWQEGKKEEKKRESAAMERKRAKEEKEKKRSLIEQLVGRAAKEGCYDSFY